MLPLPGSDNRVIFPAVKDLPVRLYHPKVIAQSDRVIVAVHGISREYCQQLNAYKRLADKLGCLLLVPEFSRESFSRYQQLTRNSSMRRADQALNTVLMVLKGLLKQPILKLHLCGYSGGAQFSHRYALLHPHYLASLILCSAGWYTFPDQEFTYPYGVGNWPQWLGKLRIKQMSQVPTLVMVGENDTKREKSLRKTKSIDLQQGLNRVERAQNWVAAMNTQKHLTAEVLIQFRQLSNVGHDFQASVKSGEMMNHIEAFWHELGRTRTCVA